MTAGEPEPVDVSFIEPNTIHGFGWEQGTVDGKPNVTIEHATNASPRDIARTVGWELKCDPEAGRRSGRTSLEDIGIDVILGVMLVTGSALCVYVVATLILHAIQ